MKRETNKFSTNLKCINLRFSMYQFKIFNVRIDLRFRLNRIHENDAVSTDEESQFRLRISIDLIDSSKSSVNLERMTDRYTIDESLIND